MTKTKYSMDNSESNVYSHCVKGAGKLKLARTSKDSDKKRRKREKKERKRLEKELAEKQHTQSSETVKTRRRFENQSGKRLEPTELSKQLTRNQLNKINTLESREIKDLLREGSLSYKEKQRRFNKYCQDVTETNEMPCLVMTKIK